MVMPVPTPSDHPSIGGFAVLDDKGRLSLSKRAFDNVLDYRHCTIDSV